MKSKKVPFWLIILFVSVLAVTACTANESTPSLTTEVEAEAEDFSCHTIDQKGQKLYGYEREEDGIWYLFVPSAEPVSDLLIHYTGNVVKVSDGQLDWDTSTISNVFLNSGDKVELTTADGTVYTVVVVQSSLPCVQIYLNDTTLDTIHLDKDVKYKNNTFVLTDPEGTYELTAKDSVEIKGRGNSTWTLSEKKGYQIKFSEKTSILGMGQAKKWVLLANAFDDSMIRSQLVYRMAQKLEMAFVPSFAYVDLWIDGEYLGTYLIGEKVEIGSSRLDLKHASGALFEHDEGFYEEEEYWFYSNLLQRHFTLKDISEEKNSTIANAMGDFEAAVDELSAYLYSTPSGEVTLEALSAMIDVDSFAKYYLINEYVLNRESFVSSFYWYKDGPEDVLHLGPVWDFDSCMGNDGFDYTQSYGDNHMLFKYLLAIPEFHARTEELFAQYKNEYSAMTTDIYVIKEEIKDSAAMNYLRWDVLGKASPKTPDVAFHDTFDEAVSVVEEWLKGREVNFSVADSMTVSSEVSEDCRNMKLYLDDEGKYTQVQFAVWTPAREQELVLWYTAERIGGVWCSTVDLTCYSTAGTYLINAYADGVAGAVAAGCNYVQAAAESLYPLNVQLSDGGSIMTITMQDLDPCSDVSFSVWSEENGQDDIQRFYGERNNEGWWEYSVDMAMFEDTGTYYIHACDNETSPITLLNATTVNVEYSD